MLESDPTDVDNVRKFSVRKNSKLHVRESEEQNFMNFINLKKALVRRQISGGIKEPSQVINPMDVICVGNRSAVSPTSAGIRELTQVRNPMDVKNVGKRSTTSRPSPYTRGPTQARSPTSVRNVGKRSTVSQT